MTNNSILLSGIDNKTIVSITKEFVLKKKCNEVNFISIWGPSGSGKSFLSRLLNSKIRDSSIFIIDDYLSPNLRSAKFINNKKFIEGLDPNIWDQELLNHNLNKLIMNGSINTPIYDNRIRERIGLKKIKFKSTIIIDGTYSIDNEIKEHINFIILLNSPFHDRFIRKLYRTYCITKRVDMDESINRYINHTESSYLQYFNKYLEISDIVIINTLDLNNDFKNTRVFYELKSITSMLSYNMIPKLNFGNILNGEKLTLTKIDDKWLLNYEIYSRTIFNFFINISNKKLLSKYYDFII